MKTFYYYFCVFCHLFLISSASFRLLSFLFFTLPILEWNVPFVPPVFLKKSLVFPILLFSSISLHCSFKKAFLSLLALLWNSTFSWVYLSLSPLPFTSLLSSSICKASSDNHFAFLHFSFFLMVLVTAFCIVLWTSIQLFCLLDLIIWTYLSPPHFNHTGFGLGNIWIA